MIAAGACEGVAGWWLEQRFVGWRELEAVSVLTMEDTIAALGATAVIVAVYWLTLSPVPKNERLLCLLPAALYLLAFCYSLAFMPLTRDVPFSEQGPFFWPQRLLYGAGVLAAVWVPFRVRQRLWPHLAQVVLLGPAAMLWLISTMALSHDWL